MAQHTNRLTFRMETAAEIIILEIFIPQDLNGYHPVEPMAAGFIYNGHAAGAQDLQDLVTVIQHTPDISIHS
jgi:hypothetical protein